MTDEEHIEHITAQLYEHYPVILLSRASFAAVLKKALAHQREIDAKIAASYSGSQNIVEDIREGKQ